MPGVAYLDTHMVANLDVLVGDEGSLGHDHTSALMASDEWVRLGRERPIAILGVEIGVADTRVLDVDQDLIGAGLGHRDLLVRAGALLLHHLGPLG
jgi:hypothetical protein